MEASEAPLMGWNADEILTMLGINTQGSRNGIQEDMLTEPEGIIHLNDEDVEGIQAACGGYAKRTLTNVKVLVMRVHFIITPQKNGKGNITISPQKNGKEHFTISPQKN